MPWSKMSIVQMDPRLSNDGPILWVRPGEQLVPTAELTKTPLKRQRFAMQFHNQKSQIFIAFFLAEHESMNSETYSICQDCLRQEKQCLKIEPKRTPIMLDMDMNE